MKAPIRAFAACYLSETGAQAGVVYARNIAGARRQVRQMYGPAYVAVPCVPIKWLGMTLAR